MKVIPVEITARDKNNMPLHFKAEFQPNNTLQEVQSWVDRKVTRGAEVVRVEVYHNREGLCPLGYYITPVVSDMVSFLEGLQLGTNDDIKRDEILSKFWEVDL